MSGGLYETLLTGALALLLGGVVVSDWRSFRIPDPLVALLLLLRAGDLALDPRGPRLAAFADAAARAGLMFGLFYLFRWSYRRWRGREGLGFGDVKLAAVAGAWVDWLWLAPVVEIAALIGFGVAALAAWRARRRLEAGFKLPFGVGFSIAIFVGWEMQRLAL